MDDTKLKAGLDKIKDDARPLKQGEVPTFDKVITIEGNIYQIESNTTITVDGEPAITVPPDSPNGAYIMPVFLVILDQGGNIINSNRISVVEDSQPANEAARQAKMKTSNGEEIGSSRNGVYVDLWGRMPGSELRAGIQTTQSLRVVRGQSTLFSMSGISGTYDDKTKTIVRKEGKWTKNF